MTATTVARLPAVIFSHGHESGPDGTKIRVLGALARARGHTVEAIDYRDLRDDPAGRAQRLIGRLRALGRPAVLVGSSMGGWVSMTAAESHPVAGLFLLAPALFLEHRVEGGVTREHYAPRTQHLAIVHGWSDDIIPWQHSLRCARQLSAGLHLVPAGHRLESVLDTLQALFADFLQSPS